MSTDQLNEIPGNDGDVKNKPKSKKWGYIIGFGFWPVVLLVIGGLMFFNRDNSFIKFINPSSEPVIITFQQYENGQYGKEAKYKFELKAGSQEELKVKEGTYFVSVRNGKDEVIRTVDEFVVKSDTADLSSFFDVLGESVYVAIDVTYLYEGNEHLEEGYLGDFMGDKPFDVPRGKDTEIITQFHTMPDEIKSQQQVVLLIPISNEFLSTAENEEAINTYINQYIDSKIDESIKGSSNLKNAIKKKQNQ